MLPLVGAAVFATALVGCGPMPGESGTVHDISCIDGPPPENAYVESEDETCAYFLDFGGGEGSAEELAAADGATGDDIEDEARGEAPTKPAYASAARPRLVYLNKNGGLYRQGRNDSTRDESTLVKGDTEIPPYNGSDKDFEEVVACIERRFARFAIDFTTEDPGNVPHIEAVLGGHPCQLGLNERVRGVAPLANNCSVVEKAVVFAFAENIKDTNTACEVTAHEIGHALGLDHEYLCDDPMTYLSCGHRSFQDVDARCGTNEPRDCACSETQNTVEHLYAVLGAREGADTEPPDVRVVSPAAGTTTLGDDTLDIEVEAEDDDGIATVKLVWQSDKTYTVDCQQPIGNVTCEERDEGRFVFRLRTSTGERSFHVQAVDLSGNVASTEPRTLELKAPGDVEPPVVSQAAAEEEVEEEGAALDDS